MGNEAPNGKEIYWDDDAGDILVTYSNVQGGWEGEDNIDVAPCFVEAGYWDANGTPDIFRDDFRVEGDYHLRLGSLCIDAGDPCYVPSANETDLDVLARVDLFWRIGNFRIENGVRSTEFTALYCVVYNFFSYRQWEEKPVE